MIYVSVVKGCTQGQTAARKSCYNSLPVMRLYAISHAKSQGKFTIIPLSLYLKERNFKMEIALVLAKNKKERHNDERKKALNRESLRELKNIL